MTAHAFDVGASPTVCPFMPVFGAPQVMFVRGSGTELWDSDGKRYLDFLGGLAVIGLGHSHPRITQVISEQAATLMHVSNLFATDKVAEAAIKINELLEEATGAVGQVFFCNSGAEANETALKLARKFGGRGRHAVVSAFGSFHGRTLAALAATGQPAKHEPFFPMPDGFRHVAYNDIEALEAAIDPSVAAVLLEPVQGEGGVLPAEDQYMRRFQLAGHRPFPLAGGATGMVGDPGGRSEERNLLDNDTLRHNVECIKLQLGRLLDFEPGPFQATLVNNADWTHPITMLEFLRDVGKHFTVNQMMAKDSVRSRIESEHGISYTEFSYMDLHYNLILSSDLHCVG